MQADNFGEWNDFLAELGRRHGVVIQLARVFGRRWSYVAGPLGSEEGLLGRTRIELGNGYGVIIFAGAPGFDPSPIVSAVRGHAGDP